MPGILPMKVIKVGNSSQSRIAQACDRCRSKKIRCDGIRPCCSQCANVGFECKTSDKLSRRAFPRGYTESLEERVRQLETENRELKDLLDEKDEKIDMLSRMHGNSARTPPVSALTPLPSPGDPREPSPLPKEDTFRVQASPLLLGVENSDSYFMGASSGRTFLEVFKRKLQESGKHCSDLNFESFLHIQGCYPLVPDQPSDQVTRVPARLFSDRCVNVYFQEWSPLFPVLHKPTFLRIYEEFVTDPEKIRNNHKLAQLYLVFSIAGLSSEQPDLNQIAACEQQWQRALDAVMMENTMITLQCLVLALMYCTVRADYKRLQHYKGIAVGLSHRLGLHQSQKRFTFGALTIETRKKVFWTLYTLDCFSAATLGLPKLMKEDDIHAEYPSDTDDEYVTEKGFEVSLPGEHTRISSALALFRATRILAKVLQTIYPAAASHELSLQQMSALQAELDEWSENLPSHLKLSFQQDKPSTNVTGSRSPLLALAYYYIRTLIHRPAVGSSLGGKAAPALISICEASKHVIQIAQLLEERNLSFSFCLNKADLLILCGMTVLHQSLDLRPESKVMKDIERLANAVVIIVDKAKAPGSLELRQIAGSLIILDRQSQSPPPGSTASTSRSLERCTPAPSHQPPSSSSQASRKKLLSPFGRHASASSSEANLLLSQEKLRRMSMPHSSQIKPDLHRARSRASFDTARPDLPPHHQDQRQVTSQAELRRATMMTGLSPLADEGVGQNLDYLPLSSMSPPSQPSQPSQPSSPDQTRGQQPNVRQGHQNHMFAQRPQKGTGISPAEWEALLGSLDNGQLNLYDAIYGGPKVPLTDGLPSAANWSPNPWDMSGLSIGDLTNNAAATAQSVLSLSDESLSSGEDMAPSDMGMSAGNLGAGNLNYKNPLITTGTVSGGFSLDGLDDNFGL